MTRSTAAIKAEFSSATAEHYTPADIIARVHEVMGGIDLDPASCAEANEIVGADRYYTEADDGLSRIWFGRVYCNPPGDRSGKIPRKFWGHLARSSAVTEFVWLAFNISQLRTLQGGSAALMRQCVYCIPSSRLRFTGASPTKDNAVIYHGPNRGRFADVFGDLGLILRGMEA